MMNKYAPYYNMNLNPTTVRRKEDFVRIQQFKEDGCTKVQLLYVTNQEHMK